MKRTFYYTARRLGILMRQALLGQGGERLTREEKAARCKVLPKIAEEARTALIANAPEQEQALERLTHEEAREYLRNEFEFNITETYLRNLVTKRLIPSHFASPRKVYFIRQELHTWMTELVLLMAQLEREKGATAAAMQEATRRVVEQIELKS